MTAICAYWVQDGAPRGMDGVRRMASALDIYGRDRYAEWSDGAIAMAIHQHHSLPEDVNDREPECHNRVALVADLRLDDRDELCRELGLDLSRWNRAADSALLRAAWGRWGQECVHHLTGDFAIAVWNDDTRTLFCARDPLGMRPLCYTTVGGALAVASMPRGLLALPEISQELDLSTLAAHLMFLPPETGHSAFRDVSILPAGHTLTATAGNVHVEEYWRPRRGDVRFRRDDDYVDRFLELYGAAVRARLRCSGPVASTLSGGLDSSSVTAVAAHELAQRGERLTALTWVPKPGLHMMPHRTRITDERRHAGAVAEQHPNIDHVLVETPDAYPLSLLHPFTDALGQPFLTPGRLPTFRATGDRLAELGCRVLLMGQHGNMTISYDGLTLLPTLFRRGRWLRGLRETAALARTPSWSPRRALYAALRPVLPGASIVHELRRRQRVSSGQPQVSHPIHPELAARYDVGGRAKELGYTDIVGGEHDGWRFRMRTIRRLDSGILFKGVQATLGFEVRDPTIDLRIVEYCLSIPEDQFLRAGKSRWLIRRAMRGLVTPIVLEEHRRGLQEADWPRFIAPYRAEFAADLREIAASPVAREIVDVQGLERLLEEWPSEWTTSNMQAYTMMLPLGVAMGRFVLGHCT